MMNITKRMNRSTKAALGLQLPLGLQQRGPRVPRRVVGFLLCLWGNRYNPLVIEQFVNWKPWPIEIDDKHDDLP